MTQKDNLHFKRVIVSNSLQGLVLETYSGMDKDLLANRGVSYDTQTRKQARIFTRPFESWTPRVSLLLPGFHSTKQ